MREQIEVLETLQQVDMELLELETGLNEYPERISTYEKELEQDLAELNALKDRKEALSIEKLEMEQQTAVNEENIKKYESRLFEIKTHKEYEALQKEISDTKRANSGIEEEILKLMEEIESLESEIGAKSEELASKQEDYQLKIEECKEKLEEVKVMYEPKKQEKENIVSKIKPEILPIYEKVRKRNGPLLALAKNEVCTGCHMNIPPQLFNEVLTLTKIIQCPNCQKILYTEKGPDSDVKTA